MEKYVITISRQYGSFGRLVAKKLSEQLHIDFRDRRGDREADEYLG